jgi:hypothetical protein
LKLSFRLRISVLLVVLCADWRYLEERRIIITQRAFLLCGDAFVCSLSARLLLLFRPLAVLLPSPMINAPHGLVRVESCIICGAEFPLLHNEVFFGVVFPRASESFDKRKEEPHRGFSAFEMSGNEEKPRRIV